MVILHIAFINKDQFSGVNTAVYNYIKSQGNFENVALLNINKEATALEWPNTFNLLQYEELKDLPRPFNKPDLVVFHEVYRPQYLTLYKLLKRQKIPFVIIPHGCLTKEAQSKKRVKKLVANVLLFNRFVEAASGIQYSSNNELEQSLYGKRKFIGTNGIELRELDREFPISIKQFVYIGRLDKQIKGLDLLVEAIAEKKDFLTFNNCKFHLYGPSENFIHNEISELISQYGVRSLVELHDAVSGNDKEAVLLDADCFVQTSRSEGMSMGILEALSFGLPCLLTKGTSMGVFFEQYDAGWICDTDSKSIAAAIEEAVSCKGKLQEKSKNAITLVQENFSLEKNAEKIVSLYRTITGESSVDKQSPNP